MTAKEAKSSRKGRGGGALHPALGLRLYAMLTAPGARRRARRALEAMVQRGEEDPARGRERLGEASLPRPAAPLVWIHVGDSRQSLGLRDLIKRVRDDREDIAFLITCEQDELSRTDRGE
ncbi:MAG: hypothetical protein D6801_05535, partial [Alphaproteobacteria bacterium]